MKAFAWSMSGFLCGQCHYAMDSSISKNDVPVEMRVKCINQKCDNYGKIFKVSPVSAFQLEEVLT